MTDENALKLVDAVRDLTQTIVHGVSTIDRRLKELDETLALIAARKTDPEGDVPTAGELFEKISTIGARAVMKSITDWEKRSGIFA